MSTIFRRQRNFDCFFCQSPSPVSGNSRSFRCPSCGCLNSYDEYGNIISEEPAMHIESLNSSSFAKRAFPSQTQLPTMYGKGPFCQICQSNQLILINLLSNYLPAPSDPEYTMRLAMLPQYRESLHLRYPPVCAECLPDVEEEIQRKNHMARTKALGGWLNESKGKEKQRRVSEVHEEKEKPSLDIVMWRIRGVLWITTLVLAMAANLTALLGYPYFRHIPSVQPTLPIIALTSLLWTTWDPTYSSFRRAKRQGRDVRVYGKKVYINMQLAAWFCRFATSILLTLNWCDSAWDFLYLQTPSSSSSRTYFAFLMIIEVMAFMVSCWAIRLHQPPTVRLLPTDSHKLSGSGPATSSAVALSVTPVVHANSTEPEFFAALSLSSKPILTPTNPVFGVPSLLSSPPTSTSHTDDNSMDWTPSHGGGQQNSDMRPSDNSWLRPQRFFAPEKPTGLEGLFERALLVNDQPVAREEKLSHRVVSFTGEHIYNWRWMYFLLLVPLGVALYRGWENKGDNMPHPHTSLSNE